MNSVHAATDVQKVIDETYVQPEYVLGSSLSEDQKNQTLKKLGYNASTDTKELKTMTPDVYSKIMNVANDPSLQLYSSAKIQKLGDKSPLEVKIETPENITKVTQDNVPKCSRNFGCGTRQNHCSSPHSSYRRKCFSREFIIR